MALRYGVDRDAVLLAALAHDIERETETAELLRVAEREGLSVTSLERAHPVLLHGPVAAWRLACLNPSTPDSVVQAVRHHTLGHADLDAVGLVLYIADYVEPGRSHLRSEERARILTASTLEDAALGVIRHARRRFGTLESVTERMAHALAARRKEESCEQ